MSATAHIIFTAEDKTKAAFDSVKKSVASVQGILGGFKHELLAIAGIVGFGAMVEGAIEAGAEVEKLSKKLGASTEALSQYRYVAESSHVTFESLTKGWQLMEKNVSLAAQGMGPAKDALQELHVCAKQLNNLKPEDQFERLADAMQAIKNPADRVRVAMQIFGRSGAELIPILNGGANALKAARLEADRLGLTLEETSSEQMAQVHEAFVRLKSACKGLVNTLVVALGPALSTIAETLSEYLPQAVQTTIRAFARCKEALTLALVAILNTLNKVFSVLGHLPGGFGRLFREGAQAAQGFTQQLLHSVYQSEAALLKMELRQVAYEKSLHHTATTLQTHAQPAFAALASQQHQVEQQTKQLTFSEKTYQSALATGKQLTESLRTPQEVYRCHLQEINQLLKIGAISHQTYQRAMKQYQRQLNQNTGLTSLFESQKQQTAAQIKSLSEIFKNGLFAYLQDGFKGLVKSFENALSSMAAEAAANEISGLLFGKNAISSGENGNLLSTGINWLFKGISSFAGFRAEGGGVLPHHSYLVGEKGPELFMPQQAGNIVPHGASNTHSQPTIVMHVHTSDAASFRRSQGQICTQVGLALQRALASHT